MFSEVMPSSSAMIVDITAQFTASNHSSSPSRTAGPSGSFDMMSSKITSPSGPPSLSGHADRSPASCERSEVQPSHWPWRIASRIWSTSSNDSGSKVIPRALNTVARFCSVVVPDSTQTLAPSMSSSPVMPDSAVTIIPWPS